MKLTPTSPDYAELSDEQVAQLFQQRDAAAYDELDRRYRPRLTRLLRRRTGSEHDAEDIAQQTLWRAYQRIDLYDPKRSLRAWLFTIAIRLSIDAARKPDHRHTVALSFDGRIDGLPTPPQHAEHREEHERVWTIAERVLSEAQHTVLWLHYVEQLDAKDIARAVNKSPIYVRVTLHRARKALAPHLDDGHPATDNRTPQPQPSGRRLRLRHTDTPLQPEPTPGPSPC